MKAAIYLLFLAGTGVLVSFRGGNISYILFYFALLLPAVTLLYSVYVYFRFKLAQRVSRVVVKADEVPYSLRLVNEDIIPFINMKLNFFSDKVTLEETAVDGESADNLSEKFSGFCLLPHEKKSIGIKMVCKYRGTYPVGVKSVSVTDFFGLFTITYPLRAQIRLTAKPRIIPIEKLRCALKESDAKNNLFSFSSLQDLPDCQLRKYYPGDRLKYIHWKNSAKTGELLVKKQMPEEIFETVIIIDLSPIDGDNETRWQLEDNVVEAALSFVNDYYLKKIPVRVVYMEDKVRELVIDTASGFDSFYCICADICFKSPYSAEKLWQDYLWRTSQAGTFILVTSSVSSSLRKSAEENSFAGNKVVIVDAGGLVL